ncbi:MAG: LacI family DNA-binding transcriptional regulator [Propioniciclava sp.]|uniref:LacI family DNA-binding transcriptional regulator n=1 Tax=Propioniciclava sp. TaxID=2038686 RepID=UPI0039E62B6B
MREETRSPAGMAEIAAAAGVAVSTVSRALSGAPGVSTAKRAQILAIARQFGYIAGDPGPSPRRTPNGRIAAVIPEADRWVFGSMLAGLHDVLTPDMASFTVYQGMSAAERAKIFGALPRRADAVILVPMPSGLSVDAARDLGVPVIAAGTIVAGLHSVGIDDVAVGQKATNYLINTGYRRIVYASYTDHDGMPGSAGFHRGQGFALSMERAGLEASWQVLVPFGPSAGRDAAEALLAGDALPEAVVAASDEMAAGMMATFRAAGVRVPDDIAIIGVDDHPVAALVGLTTIAQPAREQGRAAARMALRILAGDDSVTSEVLATKLIIRESTARPPAR